MMDWLYDELEPSQRARFDEHTQSCASCHAELESLARTREAFRGVPDEEPPASISAILLHEAAKQAPAAAVAGDDRPGLWGWLTGLLGPLVAHPAAAALATLVLVAGIAGSLYVGGGTSADEPAFAVSAKAELAPAAPALASGDSALAEQKPGAEASESKADPRAPSEEPASVAAERGLREGRQARIDDTAGESQGARNSASISVGRDELQLEELDGDKPEPARVRKAKRPRRASKRNGKASQTIVIPKQDFDEDDPLSEAAQPVTGVLGRAQEVAPAADAKGGRAADQKPARNKQAKKRGLSSSLSAGDDSDRAGSIPSGGASAPAPQTAKPPPPAKRPSKSAKTASKSGASSWAVAKRRSLSQAVRAKRCRDAARIANDIRDRDPAYYRNVEKSGDLNPCRSYVAKERRRRAAVKKSKKASPADEAAASEATKK